MLPQDQVAALKTLYPELSVATEGEVEFVRIEHLKLFDGCEPRVVTGLLCPVPRDGYPSRLFLSQKISHRGKGQNWNPNHSVVILGEQWWALSWKPTRQNQTMIEMVLDHLEAFRA
jgi:hypothetical protein